MKHMTARWRLLAILTAGVLVLITGVRAASVSDNPAVIGGPLALLLASSTDLGVSRDRSAQLTVTLASQLVAFSRRSRFQNLHSVTYGCHSSESTY